MSECYPSSTVRHPSLELSSSLDTAFFSSTNTHSFCKVLSCFTHVVHFPAPKIFFFSAYCTPTVGLAYLPNVLYITCKGNH
jgi:hypothetical protein